MKTSMNQMSRMSRLSRALAGAVTGLALTLGAGLALHAAAPAALARADDKKIDFDKSPKRDAIIFKNGNKVEGIIMEETETTLRVMVIFSESMRTPMTYEKSEILEVKRNTFAVDETPKATGDKKDDKKTDKKDEPEAMPGQIVDTNDKVVPAGNLKVYILPVRGEVGRNFTKTPVTEIFEDIIRLQPDIIVYRFDMTFSAMGEEFVDFQAAGGESYDFLEKAREIDALIDRQVNSGKFKTKPRMVAWIKKAMGPAAFLPFVFKEIYFTSDGHHGGIGGLEAMFEGVGDEVVREKQRSLRLARAVGLAEKGGHDGRIMRAMSRGDYKLSYRVVGGQVEFLEDMPTSPEWFLLKDDGAVNEKHTDSMADIVRMRGNDYLTLDAKTAFEINLSKGTADTVEDLMVKMGITRNYSVLKNRANDVLKDWSEEVNRAETLFQKLLRDYQRVQVRPPGGYKERTAARTQQRNILRQMQSVVKQYEESVNPRFLRGAPADWISRLNLEIDQIEQAQRLDRPEP